VNEESVGGGSTYMRGYSEPVQQAGQKSIHKQICFGIIKRDIVSVLTTRPPPLDVNEVG